MVDKTSEKHRSNIIIHNGGNYFAEFRTVDQLDFFARSLGFSYTFREEKHFEETGTIRFYDMDRVISNSFDGGFWKVSELPEGAKPIKALSNGSIVTCYYTNDGRTITMYRPNPNSREGYKPLPIYDHVTHTSIYGSY